VRLERTSPEERAHLYEDVRSLLVPGFLTESLVVGKTRVSVRSLTRGDYYMLEQRAGSLDFEKPEVRHWFLAAAIWMVEGQSVFEDPQATLEIYKTVQKLPNGALGEIMRAIGGLQKRTDEAMSRVRAFNFESESRLMWSIYGAQVMERSPVPGAARLGFNPVHRMWVGFNAMEDSRESFQLEWVQTKLIAATQSPKGIKKLNASDEAANERELGRRQAIMDAIYYETLGHKIDLKEISKRGQHSGIKTAVSPEELEDEMQRWRAGDKDDHDRIVDGYKRRIAERIEREKYEQQLRIEAAQRSALSEGHREASLQPLTMDEAQIASRFRNQGTSQVMYGSKANSLYERYIEHEAEPGTIVVRGGRPVALPEDKAATLQDQVRRRMKGSQ
jgi:hypothetical protein